MQVCRYTGIQECRYAGMQEYRNTGIQEYMFDDPGNLLKNGGIGFVLVKQVYRYTGMQVYRYAGIHFGCDAVFELKIQQNGFVLFFLHSCIPPSFWIKH